MQAYENVTRILSILAPLADRALHYGGRIQFFSSHPECRSILGLGPEPTTPNPNRSINLMSLFSNIANAEHTFAGWVAAQYAKFYKAEPKIEQIADTVFEYVIPGLQIILAAEGGPAAAAVVNSIATEAQKTLLVVSALIHDFGPNPTASSMLTAVQANLTNLLTAGHITNPTSVAKLQKVVNTVGVIATSFATPAA